MRTREESWNVTATMLRTAILLQQKERPSLRAPLDLEHPQPESRSLCRPGGCPASPLLSSPEQAKGRSLPGNLEKGTSPPSLSPIAHSPQGACWAATEHVTRGEHETQESQGLLPRVAQQIRSQLRLAPRPTCPLLPPGAGTAYGWLSPHISNLRDWRCIFNRVSLRKHSELCPAHWACAVTISGFYYLVINVHRASGGVWFFIFH